PERAIDGNRASNLGQRSYTNIARGGNVIQSSLYEKEVPERAIDGNRASNLGQGSCSVTNNNFKPWWRLDLLKPYQINTVTITNRGDCCPERINGAEIRIGNSLNDNGNDNPRCAVISFMAAGTSQTFVCNGMEGRYVNIVIPGRREFLTLCEVEVTGQALGNTAPTDTNIARGGHVIQSSLYEEEVPERAIDGNRASNLGQGSCSVTNNNFKPWWRLDLLKTYQINTVTITNRGDCCPERINGAEIRIGNSLNDNGNDNPRCAVISFMAAGTSQTFVCNGMEGRYVNIVIPGRREFLTLCEVEVTGQALGNTAPTADSHIQSSIKYTDCLFFGGKFGQINTYTNIARGGNVIQSSLYEKEVPERAIDGNRASNLGQRSCSVTNNNFKPWWRLDLLKTYQINTVTITNRGDCCPERINGAEIRIGNSLNDNGNDNPRCAVILFMAAGTSQTFVCNGMEGRYVNIVIPGRQEFLTLCEVEVTGQALGNTAPTGDLYHLTWNVIQGGNVIQSSLYEEEVPERAIDGIRASNLGQGSCSVTNNNFKPWWRLDLLKPYQINTVTITNRGDCCPERISGAEIRIGNSLNDNGNDNPRCAVISFMAAGTSQTFVCNGMEGRYVNIVIPGRREFLTLCEVEVTGQALGNTAPTGDLYHLT
uniref:Fucolectin tachylectin-4 pentraxin-1 domain-containing protein n=1 Tax=Sander lucioperca TaxID=283035 RepID=A0A8C9ZN50_SANLU